MNPPNDQRLLREFIDPECKGEVWATRGREKEDPEGSENESEPEEGRGGEGTSGAGTSGCVIQGQTRWWYIVCGTLRSTLLEILRAACICTLVNQNRLGSFPKGRHTPMCNGDVRTTSLHSIGSLRAHKACDRYETMRRNSKTRETVGQIHVLSSTRRNSSRSHAFRAGPIRPGSFPLFTCPVRLTLADQLSRIPVLYKRHSYG